MRVRTPGTTNKTVTKAWDDNNNQDGLRVAVTLKLVATANGSEVLWTTLKAASASGGAMDADGLITLGPGAPLSYEFTSLPTHYLGFPVTYTVDEPTVPTGYSKGLDLTHIHISEPPRQRRNSNAVIC